MRPSERGKRVARGILSVLLLGVAGVIVFVWERNRLAYQALECHQLHGYAASFQDMSPPPIPDAENAAHVYLEAFAGWRSPEWDAEEIEDLSLESLTHEQRASVEGTIKGNRKAFDLIRLARSRPRCRFRRDYVLGGTLLHESGDSKSLEIGRWIGRKAELEAARGAPSDARESIRDLLALAEGYKNEPFVVTQYLRMQLIQHALDTLGRFPLEESQEVQAWLDVVPTEDSLEGLAELAMRGELALAADLVRDPGRVFKLIGKPEPRGFALVAPLFRVGSCETLHRLRYMVEACRLPYPESAGQARRLNPPWVCGGEPIGFDFAKLHLVALGSLLDRQARTRASLAVVRAGLEFELAWERDGCYPGRLETLDPCSGSPLVLDLAGGTISSSGSQDSPLDRWMKVTLVWRLRRGS